MEIVAERLIRYLQDLYTLEIGSLQAVDHPVNRDLLARQTLIVNEYALQIKMQILALEERLRELGEFPSKIKSALSMVLGGTSEWADAAREPQERATMACIRYYALAQTKAATYEALAVYAAEANDMKSLGIAENHQTAELSIADRLFDLIPAITAVGAPTSRALIL